jgi:hypothetical protein
MGMLKIKMKNLLIILIVLISVYGCNNKKVDSTFKTINIKFAKAEIDIPKYYKKYSTNELVYALENSDSNIFMLKSLIHFLEEANENKLPSLFYCDTTNFNNRINFQKGEHVLLTKELSKLYIGTIEGQLQSNWLNQGIDYVRLDSKFKKGNKVQIIEVNYKLIHNERVGFISQYIITTMSQTIGITINSKKETNFDSIINSIRIN